MDSCRLPPYKERKKKSNKHEVSVHESGYDRDRSDPKVHKTANTNVSPQVKWLNYAFLVKKKKKGQLWLNWCCKSVDGYARIHNNLTEVTGQGKIQTLIARKRSVNKCKNSRFPCTTTPCPGQHAVRHRVPLVSLRNGEGPVSSSSTVTQ